MINQTDYKNIIDRINEDFLLYYNKYDFSKYSKGDYEIFQNDFSSLKSENKSIEKALKWKWGHAGKSNFPSAQKALIKEVESNWKDFSLKKLTNPQDTFDYWKNIFNRNTTYITTVYITHLVHYSEIPIIDQHNYRAMNYFIKLINSDYNTKKKPSNWNDLMNFKQFIDEVSLGTNIDKEKIDKYLMMYGKSIK